MPDASQLPYLLRLFDDPSDSVRAAVLAELAGWGESLDAAIDALPDPPDAERRAALHQALKRQAAGPTPNPRRSGAAVLFRVGQLVRHKRYGYRGVIVSRDPECRAPEAWYRANRSQPERAQPWYHVLVHDGDQVTYAAQSSLEADPSAEPVVHPLVPLFFHELRGGGYQRNDRPWPQLGA